MMRPAYDYGGLELLLLQGRLIARDILLRIYRLMSIYMSPEQIGEHRTPV